MDRKCIYCGKSEDLSISDIIPDALTNARVQNKNVCRTEHNNKFSDMFESEVIKALSFGHKKIRCIRHPSRRKSCEAGQADALCILCGDVSV